MSFTWWQRPSDTQSGEDYHKHGCDIQLRSAHLGVVIDLFEVHERLNAGTLRIEVKLISPQDASIPQKSNIWTPANDRMARPPSETGKGYRKTVCIFKGHDPDEEKAL